MKAKVKVAPRPIAGLDGPSEWPEWIVHLSWDDGGKFWICALCDTLLDTSTYAFSCSKPGCYSQLAILA